MHEKKKLASVCRFFFFYLRQQRPSFSSLFWKYLLVTLRSFNLLFVMSQRAPRLVTAPSASCWPHPVRPLYFMWTVQQSASFDKKINTSIPNLSFSCFLCFVFFGRVRFGLDNHVRLHCVVSDETAATVAHDKNIRNLPKQRSNHAALWTPSVFFFYFFSLYCVGQSREAVPLESGMKRTCTHTS